ncbi:MAG: CrpP-related protein [Pseudomonadota bacterium]
MKTRSKARRTAPQPPPPTAPLARPERAELQRQGAKAAARGENAASNPLHEPQNLPAATGESDESWQQRQAAWQQGHDAQSGPPDAAT